MVGLVWLATHSTPEQNTYFAGTYEEWFRRLTINDDGTGEIRSDPLSLFPWVKGELITRLTWKRTEKGIELVYPSGESEVLEDAPDYFEIKPEQRCSALRKPGDYGLFSTVWTRVGYLELNVRVRQKLSETKSTSPQPP
jgi:hypothetical protein